MLIDRNNTRSVKSEKATNTDDNSSSNDSNHKNNKNNKDENNENGESRFCAVRHPVSGKIIDLSRLSSSSKSKYNDDQGNDSNKNNKKNGKSDSTDGSVEKKWVVSGYDYTSNFTLSVCSSAIDGDNIKTNHTGAYYFDTISRDSSSSSSSTSSSSSSSSSSSTVSIGDFSTHPMFHGNQLVMEYTNGDLCPNGVDRKSTLLSFVCEQNGDDSISSEFQQPEISFIGSLHDCSYFFEIKSVYACTINESSSVNEGFSLIGIFCSILLVFIFVEFFRRQLKKIILTNQQRGSTTTNNTNNNRSSNGIYLNDSNNNSVNSLNYLQYINPRWARIEHESYIKRLTKNIASKLRSSKTWFSGTTTPSTTTDTRTPNNNNNIKLRSNNNNSNNNNYNNRNINSRNSRISQGSNETLFRDMEFQNNLIDSLEMDNNSNNNESTFTDFYYDEDPLSPDRDLSSANSNTNN